MSYPATKHQRKDLLVAILAAHLLSLGVSPASAAGAPVRVVPGAVVGRYVPPAFAPVSPVLAGSLSRLALSYGVVAGHPELAALAAIRPDSPLDLAALAPLAAALETARPGFAADLEQGLAAAEPARLESLRAEVFAAIAAAAPQAELEVQRRVGEIQAQWRVGALKSHQLEEAAQELSAFAYYGKGARDAAGLARAFARQVVRETAGVRGARARHAARRAALTAQEMREMGGRARAAIEEQEDAAFTAEDKALAAQAARSGAIADPYTAMTAREDDGVITAAQAAAAWRASNAGRASDAPLPINASLGGLIESAKRDPEAAPGLASRLKRLSKAVTGGKKVERVEFEQVAAAIETRQIPKQVLERLIDTPGVRTQVLAPIVSALAPRGEPKLSQYTDAMRVAGKAMAMFYGVGIALVAAAFLAVAFFHAGALATAPLVVAGVALAFVGMNFGPAMERARIERAAKEGPEALLTELKRSVPYFAAAFAKPIGVREGYTLEEHTLMVMRQHQRYLKTDDSAVLLTLALHDVGDTEISTEGMPASEEKAAREALQHERTVAVIKDYMGALGYPTGSIARSVATVSVDLGAYLNPARGATLEQTVAAVRAGARASGLSTREFFLSHALPYYMSDAAAYTRDAGGFASLDSLFVFDRAAGRLAFSAAARERMIPLVGRLMAETENFVDLFSRQSSIDEWMSAAVYGALGGATPDLSVREQLVVAAFSGFREDAAIVRRSFEAANPDKGPGTPMARLARETHQAYLASVVTRADGTPNPDHIGYTQAVHDALFLLVQRGELSVKGKPLTVEQFEQWNQKYKFKLSDVAESAREGFQADIAMAIGRPMTETMVINTVAGEWDDLSRIQPRGPAAGEWLSRRGDYLYGLQAESVAAIISALHDPVLLARLGSRSRAERRQAAVELMRIVNVAWRGNNAWLGRESALLSRPFDSLENGGIGIDEILKDTVVLERIIGVVDGALAALHAGHMDGSLILPDGVRAGLTRAFARGLREDLAALKERPSLTDEVARSGRRYRAPFSIPERVRVILGLDGEPMPVLAAN
ncbi:MAG: hypothetical protein SF051_05010 [Elusimicrobiota bacterium]|nr:hypothetical protein [Elusimicrobiota bacterium]